MATVKELRELEPKELRARKFMKIISLAPEVL